MQPAKAQVLPLRFAKRHISQCKTSRFTMQNGSFQKAKRPQPKAYFYRKSPGFCHYFDKIRGFFIAQNPYLADKPLNFNLLHLHTRVSDICGQCHDFLRRCHSPSTSADGN